MNIFPEDNRFWLNIFASVVGAILLIWMFSGCTMKNITLSARPNTAAVTASNAATRASIGESRSLIKKSQAAAAQGANHLDTADKTLSALLGK